MKDKEISGTMDELAKAIDGQQAKKALAMALMLLEDLLQDVRSIARSLETIAARERD